MINLLSYTEKRLQKSPSHLGTFLFFRYAFEKNLTIILKKSKKYGIKLNYGGNEYGDKTANKFNITK